MTQMQTAKRTRKMNKQMTPAEIEFVQQSPWCGLARTNWRSAMSVKERFMGLDKFDTLLGPNEAEIDSR
jgi:hypothetical protein